MAGGGRGESLAPIGMSRLLLACGKLMYHRVVPEAF